MSNPDRSSIRRRYRIERARFGQRKAILTIEAKIEADQRFISIVLPTRYGKSDVARLSAFGMRDTGTIGGALVLSPSSLLRDQIVNKEKVEAMLDRYDAAFDGRVVYGTTTVPTPKPDVNGEWLLSATTQLIQRNLDVFGAWVRSVHDRTGKRVVVYIDEAHTGSTKNKWGEVARVLQEYGAIIVLLTATPYRADGDTIPGFTTEILSEEVVRQYVTKDGSHPDLIRVEVYDGSKRLIKLRADYEYTLREAWEEDPLPVAKIEWLPFAVELNEFKTGLELASNGMALLSELPASTVRKHLGRFVRDPKVIERGVTVLVRKLREMKKRDGKIAAICFAGNDQEDDPDFNQHAKLIQELIYLMAPDIRVAIATSSTDDGQKIIEAFRDGDGDVLIVKQMASVGLDCERLKIALDLSPVRTAAAFIQRLMRIATIYRGFVGVYIAPDEPIGKGLFERFISEEGGEATVSDLELVTSYEKEREDKPKTFYTVNGTDYADFGDCDDNWAAKDLIHKVEAFRRMVPEVIGHLSHAAIAARVEAFGWEFKEDPTGEEKSFNTNLAIYTARKSIVEKIRLVTNLDRGRRGLDKDSEESYGETRRDIWKKVYQVAEVKFVEIKLQNDLGILKRLDHAADLIMAYYDPRKAKDGVDA